MDIYHFINSRDIRSHLISLKYDFTPMEAAWLIYQCRSASLGEKWAAWEELIRTMPDCRIEARRNTAGWESLHGFLREYMALQRKFINRLKMPEEGTIYIARAFGEHVIKYCSSFEKAAECLGRLVRGTRDVSICKQWLDSGRSEQIEARLLPDGTMMGVNAFGTALTDEENNILHQSFDGLWFDFPTPFRKGDILCNVSESDPVPFVMISIGTGSLAEKTILEQRKNGDTSDMNAWGYYAGGAHGFYSEEMFNYMDCEYYTGELRRGKAILSALSLYEQGKLGLEELCQDYVCSLTDPYME